MAVVQPHRTRYWLTPPADDPVAYEAAVVTVCATYQEAPALAAAQGGHTVSTDEKSGIQALERKYAGLPLRPGHVERREFEYIRHGTQCLFANFDVSTGRIVAPSIKATRTEEDFVAHIAQTVATDPDAVWVFVVDNLNTHCSASLVEWVAAQCDDPDGLGVKGEHGILHTLTTRRAFLQDRAHRIRFVYTPAHSSWLNQVEIWFGTLTRLLLKRGHFPSLDDLRRQLLWFIRHYNAVLAKPVRWTYTGRPAQTPAAPALTPPLPQAA